MDIISYILSRKYTDMSIVGLGAIKGASAQIKDIVHQDGINTVTFEWEGTDGTTKTRDMIVYDGTPIYVWESGNTYHYGDLAIYESQFYRCIVENNDTTFDSTKWNEIGSPDGNYDIVQSVNLLPTRFTAADRKLYYVIDENCFYLWNGTAWVKTISNNIADLDDVNLDDLTEGDVLVWDSVNEKWVNKAKFDEYKTAFTGTQAQWNALTPAQQNVYDIINITNDGEVINLGVYLEKKTAMPVASEDVKNKIYLYTGTTTQDFKKGVVYQCVSDGEVVPTYSWVALIDFGTAALKNSTDRVSPNNTGLVESQSVYSAINNALSSIYTPRGDITCAELTSSLLISDNVGNVYEVSDSGTTTALFLQGAGHPIAVGDNVGIISAGQGRILFNLMANAFDLTDYQKKDLANTIEGATTVEGALGALSANKQDSLTFDNVPTENSNNPVKSGGAYSANQNIYEVMGEMGAKNLIPYDIDAMKAVNVGGTWSGNEYTYNGITFAVNSDGTITVSGIASALTRLAITNARFENGKAYTMTGCPEGGNHVNAYTLYTQTVQNYDDGEGVTFNWNSSITSIAIAIFSGVDLTTPITFKPMLRLASDTDSTYQPYAKTNQQLTAENEALTNQANDMVNVLGAKNLLPFNLADIIANNTAGTWNGKTFTQTGSTLKFTLNDDGSITVDGTANSSATAALFLYGKSSLAEENDFKGMILGGCPSGGTTNGYSLVAQGFDTSATSSGTNYNDLGSGVTIGDKDYLRVYVRVQAGVTVDNLTFYPMVRLASIQDDTYEPYAKTNQQLTEDSVTWDNLSEVGAVNYCKNNVTTTTTTDGTTTFTWTVNEDKSVTVSAPSYPVTVASNQNLVIWNPVSAEENKVFVNKVWRLTGCPNSGCTIELFRVGTADGTGGSLYDNGEGLVFTWLNNASGTKVAITLGVKSGTTLTEAITFKPMIAPVSYNGDYVPPAKTNKELTDDVTRLDRDAVKIVASGLIDANSSRSFTCTNYEGYRLSIYSIGGNSIGMIVLFGKHPSVSDVRFSIFNCEDRNSSAPQISVSGSTLTITTTNVNCYYTIERIRNT